MPYLVRPDGKTVLAAFSEVEDEYLQAASTLTRADLKTACADISAITGRPYGTVRTAVDGIKARRSREAKEWLAANIKKNWASPSRSVMVHSHPRISVAEKMEQA
jgi:hypothetical protein